MRSSVPTRRLGTPFQRPAWRYDILRNPDRYGFRSFCSRKVDHASSLRRLTKKGVECVANYCVPRTVHNIANQLDLPQRERLLKLWKKQWKANNRHKLLIPNVEQYHGLINWNINKINKLNDDWLKKIIKHVSNIEFSPDIDAAIKLHLNEDYAQIKRYIGHLIFGRVPDKDIAKQWGLPVKLITALRMLFFDFSALPKGAIAQWATLVQWVNNGDIKGEEFALYRRVHELGTLGLKAQVAGAELTDDERQAVQEYLAKTATINTFNIQFSTRTPRDALIYNKVISDLARLDLQREELKIRRNEQRLLEMQVQKVSKEMDSGRIQEMQSEDLKLIQAAINTLSKQDNEPKYKTLLDLSEVK